VDASHLDVDDYGYDVGQDNSVNSGYCSGDDTTVQSSDDFSHNEIY